jgi:hypothetical protein
LAHSTGSLRGTRFGELTQHVEIAVRRLRAENSTSVEESALKRGGLMLLN